MSLMLTLTITANQAKDTPKAGGDDGSLGLGVTNLGVAEKTDPEKKLALVRAPPTEGIDWFHNTLFCCIIM